MALTQYEAAFASLRMLVPHDFRQALGWLTIVGGFASTVFWPLTHWLAAAVGWRETLLLFAALHLVPCLLLHAALPSVKDRTLPEQCDTPLQRNRQAHAVPILLALAFAAIAAVTATISTQAGNILEAMHVSQGFALSILALVGPMQVAGRLLDLRWGREIPPGTAGLIAMITLVAGLTVLVCAEYQPWALLGFAMAYGMANGVLTLVRGSAPAELMPQHDYAVSLGIISGPALFIRAAAPAAAAWLIALWGARVIPIILIVIAVFAYAMLNAAIIAARDRH